MVADTRGVVLGTHELHLVARSLQRDDNILGVSLVGIVLGNGDSLETTVKNVTSNHVLHHEVLVVLHGDVHILDNLGDEILQRVGGSERRLQLRMADSSLVELLVVADMEDHANIGKFALESLILAVCGVIGVGLCQFDKDFLDDLAVVNHALLVLRQLVLVGLGAKKGDSDTVQQRGDELVGKGGVALKSRTEGTQFICVGDGRDGVTEVSRCTVANCIDRSKGAERLGRFSGNGRHFYSFLLPSLVEKEGIIGGFGDGVRGVIVCPVIGVGGITLPACQEAFGVILT